MVLVLVGAVLACSWCRHNVYEGMEGGVQPFGVKIVLVNSNKIMGPVQEYRVHLCYTSVGSKTAGAGRWLHLQPSSRNVSMQRRVRMSRPPYTLPSIHCSVCRGVLGPTVACAFHFCVHSRKPFFRRMQDHKVALRSRPIRTINVQAPFSQKLSYLLSPLPTRGSLWQPLLFLPSRTSLSTFVTFLVMLSSSTSRKLQCYAS